MRALRLTMVIDDVDSILQHQTTTPWSRKTRLVILLLDSAAVRCENEVWG